MFKAIQSIFMRRPDMGTVIKRFPIATLLMVIFTILIILDEYFSDKDKFALLLLGLIISAYVSFCISIARETRSKSKFLILEIILAIVICTLAWFSEALLLNPFMALGAVILALGNTILWRRGRDDLKLWDFTHKIWSGAIFATVGAIIFTLGLLSISFALKSLLGIDISELNRDLLLPIGLGLLAPLYWLSTIPSVDETSDDLYENPNFVSKAVAFFGTWLLSPLTLIYALILLAYGVKIVTLGELPKGKIALLTIPFLIIGTLTWLILEPPFVKDKTLAKLFRKTWFLVSLPAVLLLAISVSERVHAYGLTPERILLIMAVIWALGIGLWFLFAPHARRDIRYIPGLAAILLLVGCFWANDISLRSQAYRFESNLKASGRINTDNQILAVETNDAAAKKAKGALQYMLNNRGEKRLESILSAYGYEGDISDKALNDALGFTDISLPTKYNKYSSNRYLLEEKRLILSGQEVLIGPFQHYFLNGKQKEILSDDRFTISSNGYSIIIKLEEAIITEWDLNTWLAEIPIVTNKSAYSPLPNTLIPMYSDNDLQIDMRITEIMITKRENEVTNLNANFSFFISEQSPLK